MPGLCQEIIPQPNSIFEIRMFPDGSERYVSVNRVPFQNISVVPRLVGRMYDNLKCSK